MYQPLVLSLNCTVNNLYGNWLRIWQSTHVQANVFSLIWFCFFLFFFARCATNVSRLSTGTPLIGRFLGPKKTALLEIRPIRGVFMV